jgi:predicted AAA+ superfamily ATPase
LSRTVGADKETIEKYIDLLEKAFIIFKLNALNRNVRTRSKKGKKYISGIMEFETQLLGTSNQLI